MGRRAAHGGKRGESKERRGWAGRKERAGGMRKRVGRDEKVGEEVRKGGGGEMKRWARRLREAKIL